MLVVLAWFMGSGVTRMRTTRGTGFFRVIVANV
jgi:hypothetical protein